MSEELKEKKISFIGAIVKFIGRLFVFATRLFNTLLYMAFVLFMTTIFVPEKVVKAINIVKSLLGG